MTEDFRSIYTLLNPAERRMVAILIVLFTVAGALETAGVAAIGPFMLVVSDPGNSHGNPLIRFLDFHFQPVSNSDLVAIVGGFVVMVLIVNNAIAALILWLASNFIYGQQNRLSQRLLKRYLYQPYSFFSQHNSSDLSKTIFFTVNQVVLGLLMPVLQAVSKTVVVAMLLCMLVYIDPVLASIVGMTIGGIFFLIYRLVRTRLLSAGSALVEADRLRNIGASHALGGAKEIIVYNAQEFFLRQFLRPSSDYAKSATTQFTIAGLPRYALEVIAFTTIVFVVIYTLKVNEQTSKEALALISIYGFAALRLLPAMQVIFQGFSQARFNRPALRILVSEFTKTQVDSAAEITLNRTVNFRNNLRVVNLEFAYRPGLPVLKGINFDIDNGNIVGIVGSSGSGKTTFVDILLGLLVKQGGDIIIDGYSLRDEYLSDWRNNIGYVSQHTFLLDGSIAENIAFGVDPEKIDFLAVERAARQAYLHDFVGNLPDKFNTIVGERGARLSGGQRQRIAIARALYRDPAILVLDEATNALDNVTEAAITDAIQALSKLKTVIIIAHRLSTIRNCDKVYVFDNGEIAGVGTYDQLITTCPRFNELVMVGQSSGVIV